MQARLYPFAIGIPMIIFAIIQVIFDLRGIESKADDGAAPVDFQMSRTVAPDVAFKRTVNIFSWFFAFFFGCWLVGFTITIPVIVFSVHVFPRQRKTLVVGHSNGGCFYLFLFPVR